MQEKNLSVFFAVPWNSIENTRDAMGSKIMNIGLDSSKSPGCPRPQVVPHHCRWPKVSLMDLSTVIVKNTQDQTVTMILEKL